MRRNNPEYEVQKSVITVLKQLNLLYCASAGGMRTSPVTAVKMKNSGYLKGFPDIFIYEPSKKVHGTAIEVKAHGGAQSLEQKKWQQMLENRGYKYILFKRSRLSLEEDLDRLRLQLMDIYN